MSPSGTSVVAGKTQQYSASGSYSDGSTKSLSNADWTSSDPTIATINANGLLTAVKQGSITVSAKSGSVTGSTSATIAAAQLVSIAVTPTNSSLRIDKEEQLVATGTFTDDTMQVLGAVTWTSSATNFATIDNTGLAVGLAPGTSTIALNGSIGLIPPANGIFQFTLGAGLSGVTAADLNGDGIKDVVVVNNQTGQVSTVLSHK